MGSTFLKLVPVKKISPRQGSEDDICEYGESRTDGDPSSGGYLLCTLDLGIEDLRNIRAGKHKASLKHEEGTSGFLGNKSVVDVLHTSSLVSLL